MVGILVAQEIRTSEHQARYFSTLAHQVNFFVTSGPSPTIRFPADGPYDTQLGYTRLPDFLKRLTPAPYHIETQARWSPRLQQLRDHGLFPLYHEKTQAGLRLLDRYGLPIYTVRYPERIYTTFAEIPDLIVQTLLFLENRELLDPQTPYRNPAMEWDRFAKALLDRGIRLIKKNHPAAGGSTLATQLEKFRHSPAGRTTSNTEKLRQMVSASLRAYQDGVGTLTARRQIVVDYLNTLPLAALPHDGEIHGLGDGLQSWYGADFAHVNQLLTDPEMENHEVTLEARALAYKQVLSLLIALRRPSFYLGNVEALNAHTDRYVRLLDKAGLISPTLRDAALHVRLQRYQEGVTAPERAYLKRKAVNAVRTDLLDMLGISQFYDLDRLDLTVHSAIDSNVQAATALLLQQLRNPEYVETAGLYGARLLEKGDDLAQVSYSVTIYERTPQANVLRVHADTLDQPFDANRGMQLDLGSTAKLRTLITYLEIVAQLHSTYAGLSPEALAVAQAHASNRLTLWALDYLAQEPHSSLLQMLNAAMERRYSANPAETFFTGSGLHTFSNFNAADNHKILSVREAFRNSINLVFIRLMRDIVSYYMSREPSIADPLEDRRRHHQEYLIRAIDQEAQSFLHRFYRKYAGKSPDEHLARLLEGRRFTPERLATVYGMIEPNTSFDTFITFMQAHLSALPDEKTLQSLYTRYATAPFTLADRGYLTRTHPLELWLVAYLRRHPHASRQEIMAASADVRHEAYQWLFKTRHRHAQDTRVRILREHEAFQDIHRAWRRLGYPFATLVPSYATAIGSSGDRPEALAELMGILVNDGVRLPATSIEQLHFAVDTPYETSLHLTSRGEQVLPPEVASVVKQALGEVVEQGTARRAHGLFRHPDGSLISLGGKTGTGDHQYKIFRPGGQLVGSRAVSRAATFVFMLDNRLFGTITAYVHGSASAQYTFTSALAVQVLQLLTPSLQLLLPSPPPMDTGPAADFSSARPRQVVEAETHMEQASSPFPTLFAF
jgi:membrane peptidoglycan carboxypeptidase